MLRISNGKSTSNHALHQIRAKKAPLAGESSRSTTGAFMKKPFWEEAYNNLESKCFGNISQEIYDLIPDLPSMCRVLDLGCGDGRNSIPLAKAGFDVTAIDISVSGIQKLNALATRNSVSILTEVADMRSFRFNDMFDLIISHGCLHMVARDDWICLFDRIRKHTSDGGYNAITVLTDTIPAPSDLSEHFVGLFREGELFDRYKDWEIILHKSYTFTDDHGGGIRHKHAANKIVAKNRRTTQ